MKNLMQTLFFTLVGLYLVEQIFYLILGSYPYRYGFVIKTNKISDFDLSCRALIQNEIGSLSIKAQPRKDEIYLRYKYPFMAIGPLLFIAQLKKIDTGGTLQIRVGPLSGLFVLFLIAYPFISLDIFITPLSQAINLLCLATFIVFLYLGLLIPINKLMK